MHVDQESRVTFSVDWISSFPAPRHLADGERRLVSAFVCLVKVFVRELGFMLMRFSRCGQRAGPMVRVGTSTIVSAPASTRRVELIGEAWRLFRET